MQDIEIQQVFLVGAKSLGAYGGYETFINKLTEYHQNNSKIKYHVACKANGDGCMDPDKAEDYEQKDEGNIAALIEKADKLDVEEMTRLRNKAKQGIDTVYSWQSICDKYADVVFGM